MRRLEIKTGERFGRLTIIEEVERYRCPNGEVKRQFKCKCDCGETIIIKLNSLKTKRTTSCGCLHIEKMIGHKRTVVHGLNKHPLYMTWGSMIQRCVNPNNTNYKYYGSRGITVCDRWRYSFPNFLEDMGEKPGPEYSIDRIDNNKGYSPENCKWVTKSEQNYNRRKYKIKKT